MLSKNQTRFINSLKRKKTRQSEGLFLAEGKKVVNEFLRAGFKVRKLFATSDYQVDQNLDIQEISEAELKKISSLTTPNQVLAAFEIPDRQEVLDDGLSLALDSLNDPGNLGTIIRLCDWFGIEQIICSEDTVDCFNPKVVQASMGSLARVRISYLDLHKLLSREDRPVYGTFMEGENLYEAVLNSDSIIVMGNEANGISAKIEQLIDKKIGIPRYGASNQTESLNVATATAIVLSELRRRS